MSAYARAYMHACLRVCARVHAHACAYVCARVLACPVLQANEVWESAQELETLQDTFRRRETERNQEKAREREQFQERERELKQDRARDAERLAERKADSERLREYVVMQERERASIQEEGDARERDTEMARTLELKREGETERLKGEIERLNGEIERLKGLLISGERDKQECTALLERELERQRGAERQERERDTQRATTLQEGLRLENDNLRDKCRQIRTENGTLREKCWEMHLCCTAQEAERGEERQRLLTECRELGAEGAALLRANAQVVSSQGTCRTNTISAAVLMPALL